MPDAPTDTSGISSTRQNRVGQFAPEGVNRTSQIVTTLIPANGTFPIFQAGTRFYIVLATGSLFVKPNSGSEAGYSQGTGLEVDKNNAFKQIQIRNPNSFNVILQIFVGFGSYIDNRLIVTDPNVTTIAFPTSPVVNTSSNILIPDLSGNAISGPNGEAFLALNRVAIYIANVDLASTYSIKNTLGTATFLSVQPKTNAVFPAQGNYSFSGGGTINATVCELYNVVKPS